VTAYSPFGQDDFPEPESAGGKVLGAVATAHAATPRQVALAFLTRRPSLFAVPKAARPAHVEDNAGALGLALSDIELGAIDAAFPRGPKPRSLPML
jgi:diketogulonate reductase-like aldo/keto reductase